LRKKPVERRPPAEPVAAEAVPAREQLERLRQQQERLFAQLDAGRAHFQRLARSVWRVQEDERRRLARELHDGIGQNLTALKHQLEGLAPAADAEAQARLAAAISLCTDTLEDTRRMSRLLRPQILDDLGLEAALRWLARTVAEAAQLDVNVDVADLPDVLEGEIATLLFRIAQEALANVARHAQAQHARVHVRVREGRIELSVSDDGRGFEPEAALAAGREGKSSGLAGMRERVALFGGRFELRALPGSGTIVRANVPVAAPGGAA
jgi:signal transduction histidine kinase